MTKNMRMLEIGAGKSPASTRIAAKPGGTCMLNPSSEMALLLSLIAGLATMIGALIVAFMGRSTERLLGTALSFASGVMLSAAFTDLLPEAEEYFGAAAPRGEHDAMLWSLVFLAVGLLFAALVDRLIPHHCACHDDTHEHCWENVSRIGVVSMIATGLHNFPEGIALFLAGYEDVALGITLALAVALHNIPGGIAIAMPVYYSSGSRGKALLYTLIPSLVQPLGAVLACFVLRQMMNDVIMGVLFSMVAGFLLYIALVELYPTSRQYGRNGTCAVALFAGVLLMPLTHILIG